MPLEPDQKWASDTEVTGDRRLTRSGVEAESEADFAVMEPEKRRKKETKPGERCREDLEPEDWRLEETEQRHQETWF